MDDRERLRQLDIMADDYVRGKLSRRALLTNAAKIGGYGFLLASFGPLLTACGVKEAAPATGGTAVATPAGTGASIKWAVTNMTTEELLAFYDRVLPFKSHLPLEKGNIGDKPIKLGFSQTGFNHPWRVEMLRAAQAECARHPNVSLAVTDGNVDIKKQSNDVDDLLAQGCDAIIMSPVESAGLSQAARKVMAAKKPLVLLDRDVPTEKTVFIGQSNITMAAAVAEVMAKMLKGKGQIAEITGLIGSSPAIDRQKGMKQILAKYPDIKVIASGDGQWIRDPAVKLMDDFLVAHPKFDAVFSHAEESSWGAQFSISRAKRCGDKVLHFTHDASNAGFQSVKDGLFAADGNYSPFIGDVGVRAALLALMGKTIPDTQKYDQPGMLYRLPDLPVVTAENADQWIGKGWGDFKPPADPCKA